MVELQQGTVLVKDGGPGHEFFVVVEGTATALRHSVWLAEFGPGSFFGELALLGVGDRTATVVADTDMSVLVLSRIEFNSLQVSVPSVTGRMLAELVGRLRRIDNLLDEASSSGCSGRAIAA